MRKNIIPPLITLLGGAAGFALRRWQLATGFEPETGLAVPGAPAAVALLVLTAVMAAALTALCWGFRQRGNWESAFTGAEENTVYITAIALAGMLMLAGAVIEFPDVMGAQAGAVTQSNPLAQAAVTLLPPVRVVLGILATPCMLLWGQALYRSNGKAKENLGLLELCLLLGVWLISDYQSHSADPVTMNYLYKVLAIVCAMLGLYYLAGYSFQTGKPRRCAVFCLLGGYLCLTTLADGHDLGRMLHFGALALFLVANAAVLLAPAGPKQAEPDEESEDEDNG